MLEAGLAEMHLGVDDARQDMEARGVDGLAGHPLPDRADLGDPAVPHANIGEPLAGMIDEGPTFEDKIEGLGQGLLLRGLTRSHKCRRPW